MKKKVDTFLKVGKDPGTGLWYYQNRVGMKSQAIFKDKKEAWKKGCQFIDFLKHK